MRRTRIATGLRDHFIPHPGNDHQPYVLRRRALLLYSVFLVLLKVALLVAPILLPSHSLYSSAITPSNVAALTNESRRTLGLSELSYNLTLAAAAQAKADDMLLHQYFAHKSPSGRTPWSWIREAGYAYLHAGENLAIHFDTAEGVVGGWLASPSHRANIVNDQYGEIGIGVAIGTFEGHPATVVVQMFGAPKDARVPAAAPAAEEPPPAAPSGPAIAEDTARVVPADDGYVVRVTVADAETVTVQTGQGSQPLTKAGDGSWSGAVPLSPAIVPASGETVTVVAADARGAQAVAPVAIIAPTSAASQVYAFAEPSEKQLRIFGLFTIRDLQDDVKKIYVVTLLLLGAALLIALLFRLHLQRRTLVIHTFCVLGLVVLLLLL